MEIRFEKATIDDVETLIYIRNQCFFEDYKKYGECPGYNMSVEDMKNSIENRISYKIFCNDQVAGNICVRDNQDGTYYLGTLCVIPEYENKGIGQKAIKFIESQFPEAILWTLKTPADKERNHYFYKKMGYHFVKEFYEGSVKLVMFEKKT